MLFIMRRMGLQLSMPIHHSIVRVSTDVTSLIYLRIQVLYPQLASATPTTAWGHREEKTAEEVEVGSCGAVENILETRYTCVCV